MKDKILFVCQRYGVEVNGGAEAECRLYAERLVGAFDVSVLTTCSLDYISWKNEYPEGESVINGVSVIRFPIERERNIEKFNALSTRLLIKHSDEKEKKWLDQQGPYCPKCIDYLKQYGKTYKCILFMTYLYYTTAYGILENLNNVILIPTAHDEWPIYLRHYKRVFRAAEKYIYNSDAEKRFVEKTFPEVVGKPSVTVGAGIEYPVEKLPDVMDRFGFNNPYICYCGRIDESKGCKVLFEYFAAYKERKGGNLKLVLTGKEVMPVPERNDVISLGFVTEEEKYAVMKEALAFVIASEYESLSIVALESMMMGRPILVNGKCEVLKDHCMLSNAGLYFTNYYEFEAELDYLQNHTKEYEIMRENGQKYVNKKYQWNAIVSEITSLIRI